MADKMDVDIQITKFLGECQPKRMQRMVKSGLFIEIKF